MGDKTMEPMELLLKWIPNSNPEFIGTFQLIDMRNDEIVIVGDAELVTDYINQEGLTSDCGWIWS